MSTEALELIHMLDDLSHSFAHVVVAADPQSAESSTDTCLKPQPFGSFAQRPNSVQGDLMAMT